MARQASAPGYLWDVNEEPRCSYCNIPATRVTPVSDVFLCNNIQCAIRYCFETSQSITYEPIAECAICSSIQGVDGIQLEPCYGCLDDVCQDCELVIEGRRYCANCVPFDSQGQVEE